MTLHAWRPAGLDSLFRRPTLGASRRDRRSRIARATAVAAALLSSTSARAAGDAAAAARAAAPPEAEARATGPSSSAGASSAAGAETSGRVDSDAGDAGSGANPSGVAAEAGASIFEQSLAETSGPDAGPTTAAPPAPSRAGMEPRLAFAGYTRGDVFVGKTVGSPRGEIKAAYGELSLAARTALESHGDGFAELRFRYGMQGDSVGTVVDVREAYVNSHFGPVDLRLGKQIVVWGRADALNPTNNLTPFDLRIRSPIEDDRRLGNVGARAFVNIGSLRIEGVWMPVYSPSELPPVALPDLVTFGATRFPQPDLASGTQAGRVHLELPSCELSLSYLYGYAPLPGLSLGQLAIDPVNPSVTVSRTAYQQHVVGLDASTALGDTLVLRGEAAYRRPVRFESRIYAPRPDLQYVVGLDHAFGPVSFIAQYMGRYVFDWRKENGPDTPLDSSLLMNDPSPLLEQAATNAINQQLAKTNQILFSQTARVQHVATTRVEWLTAHDTLSVSVLAMVNLTTREWLAAPKMGYRLSDTMTAYVGAEIFAGPAGTLFGLIDEELSAGYGELRISF